VSVDDAAALHSQLWRFRRAIALPDYAGDYPQDMLGCAGSWPLWSVYRKRHQPLPPWSPRLLQFRHESGPVGVHLGVADQGDIVLPTAEAMLRKRTLPIGVPRAP